MKERPILFSAPMVRAILEGRKTQTRRVIKGLAAKDFEEVGRDLLTGEFHWVQGALGCTRSCPYGVPGDRLWVRETFSLEVGYPSATGARVWYAADMTDADLADEKEVRKLAPQLSLEHREARWRPSIHMPRWASRFTADIVNVRGERLRDISEEDARAEGYIDPKHRALSPQEWFGELWTEINGDESWQANPWVWVVEFKKVEPAKFVDVTGSDEDAGDSPN